MLRPNRSIRRAAVTGPSERFEHAFKTALAVAIAYGVALHMDWERPYWAGWTAFSCSLATRGAGVQKALNRVNGAVVGSVIGFVLLGFFIQDRWLFVTFLSLGAAVTTYLSMGSQRYGYFWQQVGFFGAVVAFSSAFQPLRAFEVGIERVQESAAGLLVYTVIGLLVWPRDSQSGLEGAARSLVATLGRILREQAGLLGGDRDARETPGLRGDAARLQTQLGGLLDAAELDSWKAAETRSAWRVLQATLRDLGDTLARWRVDMEDGRGLDLDRRWTALPAFLDELEGRLAEVERMLAGEPPERRPAAVELMRMEPMETTSPTLGAFDRAALIVNRDRLEQLEQQTRTLFEAASEIGGFGPRAGSQTAPTGRATFVLDPDRLGEAVRVAASVWLMFLVVVFVPGIPNSLGTVGIATRLVMADAPMAPISVTSLLGPILAGILCVFPFYVLVMPQLSGFGELAPALFIFVWLVSYFLHEPKQALWKTLIAYLFLNLIAVSNEQSYDFERFMTSATMWVFVVLLLTATEYVPVPHQPDRAFLRMLTRFLRSCELLLAPAPEASSGALAWLTTRRRRLHLHEVMTLPGKLEPWSGAIPPESLGDASPAQVQSFVASLQALGSRMRDLTEARAVRGSGPIERALLADLRAWRLALQEEIRRLSTSPEASDPATLRSRLDGELRRIETKIARALDGLDRRSLSANEPERLYRLLGACRGVSEAFVEVAGGAAAVDWPRLREARF
jgi:uncharacterized membrane protein YccC